VEAAAISNAAWLEDVVVHLLCVLALDRFADYVSDQVGALAVLTATVRIAEQVAASMTCPCGRLLVRAAYRSVLAS
jgi:hypothetical protein